VPAILRIAVTTGDEEPVLPAVQQLVDEGVPALTATGITLTGLAWSVMGEPSDLDRADLLRHARTPADIPPVRLPEASADLGAATHERDGATRRLDVLRRQVQERAIRALLDDEIGSDMQEAGDTLEPVLIRLGLGGLPRAHQVAVTVDLTLPGPADTADHALGTAYDLMRVFVKRSDRAWRWNRSGSTLAASPPRDDDHWLVPWQLEYTTAVRGHLDTVDATAAAEASVRAALSSAVGGAGHDVTVTATSRSFGIDPYANPSTV
jgi:hypothetical protein